MRITASLAQRLTELYQLHENCRRRPRDVLLRKHYQEVRRTLPPALLDLFDSRRRVDRRAFAPLIGELCGSCYRTQPAGRRGELAAGKTLIMCPSCGVVLFDAGLESRSSDAA